MRIRKYKQPYFWILLFVVSFIFSVVASGWINSEKSTQIQVKAPASMDQIAHELMDICSSSESHEQLKERCYTEEFKKITLKENSNFAFAVLSELQNHDPDTKDCHLIAHSIGWGIYESSQENVSEQLPKISSNCGYGATMGFVELYISDIKKKDESVIDALLAICDARSTTFCNHIVGHIVLVETKNNVPEALSICDKYVEVLRKQGCAGGVFMEHIVGSALTTHGIVPASWRSDVGRFDAIEKLCRSQSSLYANPCWQEISEAAIANYNRNALEVFNFCNTAPTTEAADGCIRRGINIFAAIGKYNLSELKSLCDTPQSSNATFKEDCYARLVEFKLIALTLENATDTIDFCSSLESKFRNSCFSSISSTLIRASRLEELQLLCKRIPPEFKSECSSG
jgi:hypothetical protein